MKTSKNKQNQISFLVFNYLKLMRPKHYIKNFLIFLPLIFSEQLFSDSTVILNVFFGFTAFSFTSSIIYIINDLIDAPKDRLHEKKKNRPIASKAISEFNAIIFSIILLIVTIVLLSYLKSSSFIFILIYFSINFLYSFKLKNIPILDITIIATGFLIRVLYGGSLANVEVSNWLYLTITFISFYLGLGKRRNEIKKTKGETREVLKYYNKEFLDKNMYMCLGATIVFYALWCTDPFLVLKTGNRLIWTVPFVLIILLRYSLQIETKGDGDPVEVISDDKILLSLIALYSLIIFFIIYII